MIGAGGVEKIVQIELTAEEKANLDKSAGAVRELLEASPPAVASPPREGRALPRCISSHHVL